MTVSAAVQMRTRVLDPVSRATEILFGLIMVLTFTASLNVAEAGRTEVRLMLVGALGCNLAWGLIDAALYLMSVRTENAISLYTVEAVRSAPSPALAHREIAQALPPVVATALGEGEFERIRLHLLTAVLPGSPRLGSPDYLAATAIFLLVFFATLPVALPFVLMDDPRRALWVSHGVAVVSLFLAGRSLGGHWGSPWRVGLAMVVVGIMLVGVALALGG